jgi:hypothetical protein
MDQGGTPESTPRTAWVFADCIRQHLTNDELSELLDALRVNATD